MPIVPLAFVFLVFCEGFKETPPQSFLSAFRLVLSVFTGPLVGAHQYCFAIFVCFGGATFCSSLHILSYSILVLLVTTEVTNGRSAERVGDIKGFEAQLRRSEILKNTDINVLRCLLNEKGVTSAQIDHAYYSDPCNSIETL